MIRKITPTGVVTTLAGTPTKGFKDGTGLAAAFEYPAAVAVDAGGNVYVADQGNNLIRKVTAAGVVTTLAGTRAAGANNGDAATATFYDVIGIAVDASGNVYVSDQGNNLIRKYSGWHCKHFCRKWFNWFSRRHRNCCKFQYARRDYH